MGISRPNFIVGVGGSAGGLNGYKELLDALPSDTGVAIVIVAHIPPDAISEMSTILARHTKMPVMVASTGMRIRRNCVYVIPPNADLLVDSFSFKVISPRAVRGTQIDVFFASLADSMGVRAVGIVLSGYFADGTEGCRYIKEKGGTTFAQDASAEVQDMSLSAQESGSVDFVLAPGKIPGQLQKLIGEATKSARSVDAAKGSAKSANRLKAARPQQNQILAALPADVQGRLFPYLEVVPMTLGMVLYESGDTLTSVYFPTDAIVALLYEMESGASSEIAMVGNDGIVGISLFMGGGSTTSRAIVQSPGCAYRLGARRFKEEFNRHGAMMPLLLRYTQALLTQMAQTAACNRHHSVEQRLCRWLLLSLDRLTGDQVAITHDLLADMLGVRREGITMAAGKLQEAEAIEYTRGKILILDRAKLESLSCECYAVVKRETDRLGSIFDPIA